MKTKKKSEFSKLPSGDKALLIVAYTILGLFLLAIILPIIYIRSRAVRELLAKEDVTFFHDLAFAAQKAMQADAEKAMIVFMRTGSPHF